MASSLDQVEGVQKDQAGSQAYQSEHMGLIFSEGFSFSGFERDLLFMGDGDGHFADLSAVSGLDDPNDGRSVVLADFDDDGDADLFVHNIARARHRLYRNDSRKGRAGDPGFVKVQVRGTQGAPEAPGAVVRLTLPDGKRVAQVVSLGSGFVSQAAPELIFGLGRAGPGSAPGGSLSVTWPGGQHEQFGAVTAGARVLLVQGQGEPTPYPARPSPIADPAPAGLKVDLGADLSRLTALDLQGREVQLDLASDGETWLNFWATWCAACQQELPDLVTLDGEPGKRVIAVSVDVPEERGAAQAALAKQGAKFQSVFLSPAMIESLVDVDRLALPTTLVLDRQGKLTRIVRGRIER